MKTKALVFAITAVALAGTASFMQPIRAEAAKPSEPAKPTQPNVTLAGLTWHGSLDEALQLARKQGKPVLHLQMFGKLDDAFC